MKKNKNFIFGIILLISFSCNKTIINEPTEKSTDHDLAASKTNRSVNSLDLTHYTLFGQEDLMALPSTLQYGTTDRKTSQLEIQLS